MSFLESSSPVLVLSSSAWSRLVLFLLLTSFRWLKSEVMGSWSSGDLVNKLDWSSVTWFRRLPSLVPSGVPPLLVMMIALLVGTLMRFVFPRFVCSFPGCFETSFFWFFWMMEQKELGCSLVGAW